jgi:putative cell wall-binding protein
MRRRWLGGCALAFSAALAASVGVDVGAAPPALGADTTRLVAPGVELRSFSRVDPSDGLQEVRVLRFRLDAPAVRLAPIAAADLGASRLPVTQIVSRSGALAAINGDFFTPSGNVRGLLTIGGILRSEPEAAINGATTPRASWRIDPAAKTVAFGRPGSELHLHKGDTQFSLNGLDRVTGYLGNPDEAVIDTPRFAAATSTPLGGVDVVLDGMGQLRPDVPAPATVAAVRDGGGPIPPGGAVVSAVGANAQDLRSSGLAPGDSVEVHAHFDDPLFAAAADAGGGGPWLLQNGQQFPRADMLGEGFAPSHLDQRAPRSAIGRTADGTVLLVTVDGRQPGRSNGATINGLVRVMKGLGATDAISLDGGGSTAMSVDGLLANVPSGEDSTGRPGAEASVADAIGVYFDFTPTATVRVSGVDRVDTAIQISRRLASAPSVLIATSNGFADALVGSPLAASLGAPVLLTPPGALDARVATEVKRLGATTAYVLGGEAALAPQVAGDLAALGVSVQRVAGADRYATAAAVASRLGPAPTVLVASGERFPAALAAGALGLPVLLTTQSSLPDVTSATITSLSATPIVVGGASAVDPSVLPGAARVAGADRYATSAAVADWGLANGRFSPASVVVARGDTYPDALVGGALRQPLVLVGRFGLGEAPPTRTWLDAHAGPLQSALLLGGRQALSTLTQVEVEGLITRP